MAAEELGGLLMFRQDSMYYLTGYDSFGYSFFQCPYLGADGRMFLLTRLPDFRQAQQTSIIEQICVWVDAPDADPAGELREIFRELGCACRRLGVEYEANGLTARNGPRLERGVRRVLGSDRRLGADQRPTPSQQPRQDRLCSLGRGARRHGPQRGPHARPARRFRGRDSGRDAGAMFRGDDAHHLPRDAVANPDRDAPGCP